ncbi:MAG: biliverdin-producing heme oxygenase, partial [Rhizobiales bacterium]|nr:biliverdin-producing heme oxygenase [Hyphomicrobiales bacterium]
MRDILKTQTRDLHIELDEAFSELKLQNHHQYGKFLITHAWVIIPLEKQLIRSEKFNIIPTAEKRLRSSSIKSDLACLALNEPETNSTTMSYINALSEIAGIMYVLEGSRLGAK